ncbi:hypothetical protein BLNAU_4129 [Blattamonas nauphoetae]|uniref:Uncharacterized protein n=1 Tax=Blattamonas nauphoetae TaxID=2049346 RepID=A0ABQ9YBD5_9EUKA|nr:hypothetical protein BLNAU_4129 [Blattamonas nauphoetae]
MGGVLQSVSDLHTPNTHTLSPLDSSCNCDILCALRVCYHYAVDAFLGALASITEASSTVLMQSILVLVSSASPVVTTAGMTMLSSVMSNCSENTRFSLVKADLIPQLVFILNPLSLSFTEAVDIHCPLLNIITVSLWPSTPDGLEHLGIQDASEQRAVHKTIVKQVLVPSENCLTFFETDFSVNTFLMFMVNLQWRWNTKRGDQRQMWKNVLGTLRKEGIEDEMEKKHQNDKEGSWGKGIVTDSIAWNNLLGMNLPRRG